jgi:hypothetical protein
MMMIASEFDLERMQVNVDRSMSEVGRLRSDKGRMNWECVLKAAMYPTP